MIPNVNNKTDNKKKIRGFRCGCHTTERSLKTKHNSSLTTYYSTSEIHTSLEKELVPKDFYN
jgi:hypothetical protein